MKDEIERVYETAAALWRATEPAQRPGCGPIGCPGVFGPASDDANWTEEQGKLDGAIYSLQEVRKRVFG